MTPGIAAKYFNYEPSNRINPKINIYTVDAILTIMEKQEKGQKKDSRSNLSGESKCQGSNGNNFSVAASRKKTTNASKTVD